MLDTAGARSKPGKKPGRQSHKTGHSQLPSPPKDRQSTVPKQGITQKSMFSVHSNPRTIVLNNIPVTTPAGMTKSSGGKPSMLNKCSAPTSPSQSSKLPHTAPLSGPEHPPGDASGGIFARTETGGIKTLKHARSLGAFRDGKVATFDNGMRTSSEGHGRMDKDYCGVVLPLLPAYGPEGKGPHNAPWMVRGEFYELLLDGYNRLGHRNYRPPIVCGN